MEKKRQSLIWAVVVIWLLAAAGFAEVPRTTGAISEVTVYRGQALVTRSVDVDLPAGTSELIVTDLPARIVPESLYAQTLDDIKVLSVRYREKAVKEDTREEVKELEEQIEEIRNQIFRTEQDRHHAELLWQHYEPFWKLTIDAAKPDLNRALLQAEPIENLTTHLESKWIQWHQEKIELQLAKNKLEKELGLLNRKRKELDASRARTEREAVLFINNEGEKKATIDLSYLVNGANWLPKYNFRAEPNKSNVLIEYNAVVNQTSGEDWDGVALSLSTAEPTMVAAPPVLEPMLVELAPGAAAGMGIPRIRSESKARPVSDSREQAQQEGVVYRDISGRFKENIKRRQKVAQRGNFANAELNMLAVGQQMMEFQADKKAVQIMKKQAVKFARTEGVSVSYDLAGKLTLPSRTDQQLVNIATITAKAEFTMIATPLLTDYVYRQAELLNDSDTILLAGQASMFRNGEFVGKSQLPIVTIGEKFTAGFGIDSQVQVARELEDKKTRIQGGNRIDTYHYRIALSNYKNTAVELRLLDRLPYTDDDSIKIELEKTEPELSKDGEYLRTARKKGILRWDLNLAPNTVNESATVVKYSFTMEYDKNMQIQPR